MARSKSDEARLEHSASDLNDFVGEALDGWMDRLRIPDEQRVVWAYEDAPFTGADVKELLLEFSRLRAAAHRLLEAIGDHDCDDRGRSEEQMLAEGCLIDALKP